MNTAMTKAELDRLDELMAKPLIHSTGHEIEESIVLIEKYKAILDRKIAEVERMSEEAERNHTEQWNRAYGAALQAVVMETDRNTYQVFDARTGQLRTRGKLDGHPVTRFTEDDLTFVLSDLWEEREGEGPTPDPVKVADEFMKFMDGAGAL